MQKMNSNKFTPLLYLCLIFFYTNALALDCNKNSSTQSNMTVCANEELNEETKKLDSTYKAYIKFLDGKGYRADDKKYFIDSHIAWIKYKDSYCKFISGSCEGGSMCEMVWADCQATKTKERLQEIEKVFEYEKRL